MNTRCQAVIVKGEVGFCDFWRSLIVGRSKLAVELLCGVEELEFFVVGGAGVVVLNPNAAGGSVCTLSCLSVDLLGKMQAVVIVIVPFAQIGA